MPAALLVLLLVFGAVLAAFMPIGLAVISIILALAFTALIGQVYTMSTFVLNIISMMGLAVGIDYTLFIIAATARSAPVAWRRSTPSPPPGPPPTGPSSSAA